jgi:multidrug efflux pump subunit AcrA (membrane-fusion protein)
MLVIIGLVYWLATRRGKVAARLDLPVALSIAPVLRSSVVISITELGAAQAWQGIAIRAQVNGGMQRVVVQECADVKAGDLIAEIDPSPDCGEDLAIALAEHSIFLPLASVELIAFSAHREAFIDFRTARRMPTTQRSTLRHAIA